MSTGALRLRSDKKSSQYELLQLINMGVSKLEYIYNGLWRGILFTVILLRN